MNPARWSPGICCLSLALAGVCAPLSARAEGVPINFTADAPAHVSDTFTSLPNESEFAGLLAQLDDTRFDVREQATRRLAWHAATLQARLEAARRETDAFAHPETFARLNEILQGPMRLGRPLSEWRHDLDSADSETWLAALAAFESADEAALPFVRDMLTHSAPLHQTTALWLATRLGARAAPLLPALEARLKILNDTTPPDGASDADPARERLDLYLHCGSQYTGRPWVQFWREREAPKALATGEALLDCTRAISVRYRNLYIHSFEDAGERSPGLLWGAVLALEFAQVTGMADAHLELQVNLQITKYSVEQVAGGK